MIASRNADIHNEPAVRIGEVAGDKDKQDADYVDGDSMEHVYCNQSVGDDDNNEPQEVKNPNPPLLLVIEEVDDDV